MHLTLHPHPGAPSSPIREISVTAVRLADGRLSLVFVAAGNIARLRIPSPCKPARADDLWRRTCFEAFVAPPDGETYFEFNLSPSCEWAAYRFDGYRSGMTAAQIPSPIVKCAPNTAHLPLVAGIDLGTLPELVPGQSWRLGLSAVIEADDGTISHWALSHPPGAPDFHHQDCFAEQLAPPDI